MKTKIKLLLGLLLTIFITLPTTCNAEEVPIMKWEDITTNDYVDSKYLRDKLYNINDDILNVHNSESGMSGNYIRLYTSSGEKKWEYIQKRHIENYFLIDNEYFALVEYVNYAWEPIKSISLIDLKTGKVTKKVDISKTAENLESRSMLIYTGYSNDKIILIYYDWYSSKNYHFYAIDLDGNIKTSKNGTFTVNDRAKPIAIGNNIYIVNTDEYATDKNQLIVTLSIDTGEIVNTTPINTSMNIVQNINEYKDGFLILGSKNGYMAMEYYDLKTNKIQTKQFEEEGMINSISIDNEDNMYIAGKYVDENTLGKAYFSKYTINNWNFKKVYEIFYEKEEYDEYFFKDVLALKNNKLILAGNIYGGGRYYAGEQFIVFYDINKNYKIDKIIKGSGNIDIAESGEENNEIKYQVKPAFGYKLISLKIVTESGKEIEVSDDYSFIMPDENITITATFEPIISNPVTSNNIIKIILETAIFITFIYGTTKCIKKNRNQINSKDY